MKKVLWLLLLKEVIVEVIDYAEQRILQKINKINN